MNDPALLDVVDLKKHYHVGNNGLQPRYLKAVDGVSFSVNKASTFSIVGESGCGKSTVGRAIMGLTRMTSGEIWMDGQRIDQLSSRKFRPLRRHLQMIYQNPFGSLNPRMTVRQLIAEPVTNFGLASGQELERRIDGLLDMVKLPSSARDRLPHEFSGGQRQRISIARALAPSPRLVVCDEAVSALDVSVKAQIVNLLVDLQKELDLSLIFISHDLAIVEYITDDVGVMYLGQVVERGSRHAIFKAPRHPYTRALLDAVPLPKPGTQRNNGLQGEIPSPLNPPSGCSFHTRCPFAFDRCRSERPALTDSPGLGAVACHLNDGAGLTGLQTSKKAAI